VAATDLPDLTGKVIVVHARFRPLTNPAVLAGCRFESQLGRIFLVGVRQPSARDMPSWADGAVCCIAWECVEEYLVFDSLGALHGRLDSGR
jgi:hypothetical protein